MKAAQQMYEQLSNEIFPDNLNGLLHWSRPGPKCGFASGRLQTWSTKMACSTTVIEVGVDVLKRNHDADRAGVERFAPSQLHQLRGRVGRAGREKSYCLLITAKLRTTPRKSASARSSIQATDSKIAEMDLKLRGLREFFGTEAVGIAVAENRQHSARSRYFGRREVTKPAPLWKSRHRPMAFRAPYEYIKGHWQRRYGLVQVG